jgi:hypothetical protein
MPEYTGRQGESYPVLNSNFEPDEGFATHNDIEKQED